MTLVSRRPTSLSGIKCSDAKYSPEGYTVFTQQARGLADSIRDLSGTISENSGGLHLFSHEFLQVAPQYNGRHGGWNDRYRMRCDD